MKRASMLVLCAALAACLGAAPAAAETARRDSDEQRVLAKTQYLLKQVSTERDALKAENEKLKAEIDALNKKSAGQKKSAETALAKSKEEYAQMSERLQEAIKRLETEKQALTTEKQQRDESLTRQSKSLEVCETKNARLVEANLELLHRYENKGVFDALFQREPVTGLKQVEIESLIEEYRDKMDALKVKPQDGGARVVQK